MTQESVSPDSDPVGVTTPNTARVWDYQLGGKDNFEIDRKVADQLNSAMREMGVPDGHVVGAENRAFLHRAVTYLAAEAGVSQFLDLGAGLPTMANTHHIAQRVNPEARVVYVDLDPVVSVHANALLAEDARALPVRADLRDPDQVLGNAEVRDFLDFDKPIAVMCIALLHCLADEEDPFGVVRRFRDAVAPGSYLAVSQLTTEDHPREAARLHQLSLDVGMSTPLVPRPRAAIEGFFDGFTLVEPGLVFINEWRPSEVDEQVGEAQRAGARWFFAGVGRKD
jgi:S-adenosyl methyltransferase